MFLYIILYIFEPTSQQVKLLKQLDHKSYKQREDACKNMNDLLQLQGTLNYGQKMEFGILLHCKTPESQQRSRKIMNVFWTWFFNPKPYNYWKMPWIEKAEFGKYNNKGHQIYLEEGMLAPSNWGTWRYATLAKARDMLLKGIERQEVINYLNDRAREELRWWAQNSPDVFLMKLKAQLEKK